MTHEEDISVDDLTTIRCECGRMLVGSLHLDAIAALKEENKKLEAKADLYAGIIESLKQQNASLQAAFAAENLKGAALYMHMRKRFFAHMRRWAEECGCELSVFELLEELTRLENDKTWEEIRDGDS